MRKNEAGFGLVLVLILLALGSLLIAPVLGLTATTLKAKQINTLILEDQYARDGAGEFAIWQLEYGGLTSVLSLDNEEETYTVTLNGIETLVTIKMRTELGTSGVVGAEGDTVRPTIDKVECSVDGGPFGSCVALPKNNDNMIARYTIKLEQLSPDAGVMLEAIYDELPPGFNFILGTVKSVGGSFLQIDNKDPDEVLTQGQTEFPRWDFSPAVPFTQGDPKIFSFEATINKSENRYCNDVFLKMSPPPNEQAGKSGVITVGTNVPDDCDGLGVKLDKVVDTLVVQPGNPTVLTYIINVQNLSGSQEQIGNVKDVLPQGGFLFCNAASGLGCVDALYRLTDTPFDAETGDFEDTDPANGWLALNDPAQTTMPAGREELIWDFTGGNGCALQTGCNPSGQQLSGASGASHTLTIRFQSSVTLEESGSYFNEVFVDVLTCTAPDPLEPEVTTDQDYCSSYSWPTGGTLVPMYDVNSEAERTSGQGNVSVGAGQDTTLESWHVDDL